MQRRRDLAARIGAAVGAFLARRAGGPLETHARIPPVAAEPPPDSRFLALLKPLQTKIARDRTDAAIRLAERANEQMDTGAYAEAPRLYQESLLRQESAPVCTDLGICYQRLGDREKAEHAFRTAIRNDPSLWQAEYNLAVVLAELGRIDEAHALALRLEATRPYEPQVRH